MPYVERKTEGLDSFLELLSAVYGKEFEFSRASNFLTFTTKQTAKEKILGKFNHNFFHIDSFIKLLVPDDWNLEPKVKAKKKGENTLILFFGEETVELVLKENTYIFDCI